MKHICKRSAKDQALIDEIQETAHFWMDKYRNQPTHKCPEPVIPEPHTVYVNRVHIPWVAYLLIALAAFGLYAYGQRIDVSVNQLDKDSLEQLHVDSDMWAWEKYQVSRKELDAPVFVQMMEGISADIESGHLHRADRLVHEAKEMAER